MTISNAVRKAGPYSGNGETTVFPFGFKVFADTDVVVVHTNPIGVETTKLLGSDYSVTLNADQDVSSGGSITMFSAPSNGELLTVTSAVPSLQPVNITNGGGFYPSVLNAALDRVTIIAQQLEEQLDRAVKVDISSSTDPAALIQSVISSSAAAVSAAAQAQSAAEAAVNAVPVGSLAYTPVDVAGDTMTGTLEVPALIVNGSTPITTIGSAATKSTGTAAGNVPLNSDVYGKQTIWIPAGAMTARSTNGAEAGLVETTTNKVMLKTLDFDTATDEYAQFFVRMPKSWNESTVTAYFVWSHAATTTNFGVVFGLAGVALGDDDAADVAFGTQVTVADTGGTTNDIYQTAETAAITIAGTPAAGDWVVFQVRRNVSDGSDTMAIDARLHGVVLLYTTDAHNDA